MIVRVVIYEADAMEAAEQWHRDRADEVEEIPGLERAEFIRNDTKSRAGAIMYFDSAEALRAYKASERFEWLRESIREDWAAAEPVQDVVYRVMDAPENAAAEV